MPGTGEAAVDGAVQVVASSMWLARDALAADLLDRLLLAQPEVVSLGVRDQVAGSVRANAAVTLDALSRNADAGDFAPTVDVLAHTRAMVRAGLSFDSILRGYRLSTSFMVERWTDEVAAHPQCPPELKVAAVRRGSSYLLGVQEAVLSILEQEYQGELRRVAADRSQSHFRHVLGVVDGSATDEHGIGRRLGHHLGARHVGIVLRAHDDAGDQAAGLERAWRRMVAALGLGPGLTVMADERTQWAWFHADHEPDLPPDLPPPGMTVAIGTPSPGLAGFRRTHHEARRALAVACLAAVPARQVRYAAVELVSLVTTDPAAARGFCDGRLGVLGGTGAAARRQRETLAAFLGSGMNFRATAAVLGVHHNTVRYRLETIEKALGHPVRDRRLELEVALRVHAAVHPSP